MHIFTPQGKKQTLNKRFLEEREKQSNYISKPAVMRQEACRISGEVCHLSAGSFFSSPPPYGSRKLFIYLFTQQIFMELFSLPGPTFGGGESELNKTETATALLGFAVCGKDRHETSPPQSLSDSGDHSREEKYMRKKKEVLNPGRTVWKGFSEKVTLKLRPRVETLKEKRELARQRASQVCDGLELGKSFQARREGELRPAVQGEGSGGGRARSGLSVCLSGLGDLGLGVSSGEVTSICPEPSGCRG